MESGPRRQTIAAAAAQVEERAADLEYWTRELAHFRKLRAEDQATQKEFDDTVSRRKMAAARLEVARQNLDELEEGTRREQIDAQRARVAQLAAAVRRIEIDLDKSVLTAPFNGSIARRYLDEGTVVSAGSPIVEVLENETLEARVGVPADMAEQLAVGQQHALALNHHTVSATVSKILPRLDAQTRTVTVVLNIDDENRRGLLPGRIVRLELAERIDTRGFWLPVGALVKGDRGLWSAYALVPADRPDTYRVQRRDVETLYTESNRVLVRGLLSPGELVVSDGVHRIVPDQLVTTAR
jgi:RND family efflux transporter MFP subunit